MDFELSNPTIQNSNSELIIRRRRLRRRYFRLQQAPPQPCGAAADGAVQNLVPYSDYDPTQEGGVHIEAGNDGLVQTSFERGDHVLSKRRVRLAGQCDLGADPASRVVQ